MSSEQLEKVIADCLATFGAWGPETTLEEMRASADKLFSVQNRAVGATSEEVDAGGVRAEWITAPGVGSDKAVLYVHGGGYVLGSIDSHRDLCERLSRSAGARVLSLDYRLAPEDPFPAAVDDSVAAYNWLLGQGLAPGSIAIAGDSAGGGLVFGTLVALRDAGAELPACATPISPWVDLEGTGETMDSKADLDPMVQKEGIHAMGGMYVPTGDLKNPLAAPLYADLSGLPPLLIHVGTRETLLDDAIRMHDKAKAAGVDVTLDIWEGQIHVWHLFSDRLDEGEEAIQQLGTFMKKHMD